MANDFLMVRKALLLPFTIVAAILIVVGAIGGKLLDGIKRIT